MNRPAPEPRSAYRAFQTLPTRWADNDAYGHMNNAAYLGIMDTAISLWQISQGLPLQGPEAMRFVVVETGIRYHAELGFPDIIHAGLRLGHLGSSSLRFDVGLFRNDDPIASATGHFAQVLTGEGNRPKPIPAATRAVFLTLSADYAS